jgi:hypothetical protein
LLRSSRAGAIQAIADSASFLAASSESDHVAISGPRERDDSTRTAIQRTADVEGHDVAIYFAIRDLPDLQDGTVLPHSSGERGAVLFEIESPWWVSYVRRQPNAGQICALLCAGKWNKN